MIAYPSSEPPKFDRQGTDVSSQFWAESAVGFVTHRYHNIIGTTVPFERVRIGRGHTEISLLWNGICCGWMTNGFFSFALVVR